MHLDRDARAALIDQRASQLAEQLGDRLHRYFDLPVDIGSDTIETEEGLVSFVILFLDGWEVFRATGDTPCDAIDTLSHLCWDAFVLAPRHCKGEA